MKPGSIEHLKAKQANDLKVWKRVLKPEVVDELKEYIEKVNKNATAPWGIIHGPAISNILYGIAETKRD